MQYISSVTPVRNWCKIGHFGQFILFIVTMCDLNNYLYLSSHLHIKLQVRIYPKDKIVDSHQHTHGSLISVFWMWVREMIVRVCMRVCIQQESQSDKSGTAHTDMACMVSLHTLTHIGNKELRKSGSLLVSRIQLSVVSFQFWVMPRLKTWKHITTTGTWR